MNISLLTFSKAINYGANLQCYALCKILQKRGHQVKIIDIQLKEPSLSWYSTILQIPRKYIFRSFRKKYLNYFTHPFKDMDDLHKDYPKSDLYIVGSDQVWNTAITKSLDPLVYFFSFLPKEAHRISYAASFGTKTWDNPELTSKVNQLLNQFDAISVREDAGKTICKETFNTDAALVLDPTLLLTSYDDICGKYDVQKETEDLVYFTFINDSVTRDILADFAESHNLRAMLLSSNRSYPRFRRKMYVSVKEWLNTIRYAKIVVTNSFHCMVFCLIFHKPFVAIPGKANRTSRQEGLLNQLGLSEYYCNDSNKLYKTLEMVLNKGIDYNNVDLIIRELRKKSLDFITKYC